MENKREYLFLSSDDEYYEMDKQFYNKNGVLKSETDADNAMGDIEFKNNLKNKVSGFINRSFENIVVLVGAGGSVVTGSDGIDPQFGKTVAMLAQDVNNILKSEKYVFDRTEGQKSVFTLDRMAKEIGYLNNIYAECDTKKQIIDSNKFDLEDFLSRLITFQKFVKSNKTKWETSRRAIFDVIKKETSYDFDKRYFEHAKLINILSKKLASENKLTVVTTNYDTLLEDAAESLNFTVFDGFSFSQTPKFDDDMFEWHLSKHVSNIKTQENIYKKQVIDLLKIHGSLTWEKGKDGASIVRKEKGTIGEPVMIFPSSNKYMQSYEEPYFELFSRFQEMLKKPNTLLITIGFSFADNHISRMITQAIKHNLGLYTLVTDFNIKSETKNQNWKDMLQMMNETYEIIFLNATLNGSLTDYLGEENVR